MFHPKSHNHMSTVDILSEIKKLSMSEQLLVVEKALHIIRHEERRDQMQQAAEIVRNDYLNDPELTGFTALDGEPVHESI